MRKVKVGILLGLLTIGLCGCSVNVDFHWNFDQVKSVIEEKVTQIFPNEEDIPTLVEQEINENVFRLREITPVGDDTLVIDVQNNKGVPMLVSEGILYTINVPKSMNCITDNENFLYASDSSVVVSILSGIPVDQFSPKDILPTAEFLDNGIYVVDGSPKSYKGIVKHICNDRVLVVKTYDNDTAYHTILNGVATESWRNTKIKYCGTKNLLDNLPLARDYHEGIDMNFSIDDKQVIYAFDKGSLVINVDLHTFDDAVDLYRDKLVNIKNDNVFDKEYATENIYYAELGMQTLGIYAENYNTSFILYGNGDEARYNIIQFLKLRED